jgi:hypothetical protein
MADDSELAELTIETFLKLIAGSVKEQISKLPENDSSREAIIDANNLSMMYLRRLALWFDPLVKKMTRRGEKSIRIRFSWTYGRNEFAWELHRRNTGSKAPHGARARHAGTLCEVNQN